MAACPLLFRFEGKSAHNVWPRLAIDDALTGALVARALFERVPAVGENIRAVVGVLVAAVGTVCTSRHRMWSRNDD